MAVTASLRLQQAVERSQSHRNSMQPNCEKTKEMLVHLGKKTCSFPLVTIGSVAIERLAKLLGVVISDTLNREAPVDYLCAKASQRLYFLTPRRLSLLTSLLTLLKRAGVGAADIIHVDISMVRSLPVNSGIRVSPQNGPRH